MIAATAQHPDASRSSGTARSSLAKPQDRLDSAARRAWARAYWEAGRANETEVMPHHLLLALVADEEMSQRRAFEELAVDPAKLVTRIDATVPPRSGPRLGPVTQAPAS